MGRVTTVVQDAPTTANKQTNSKCKPLTIKNNSNILITQPTNLPLYICHYTYAITHIPLHMHHQPTAWTPSQIVYIRNLVCAEINIWSLPSAAALSELSVSQIVAVCKLAPLCTNVPNDPKAQWS